MLKNYLLPFALLLTCLTTAPPVYSEVKVHTAQSPQDKRWYVAPSASLVKSGGAQDGDDGWAGRIAIGKMLNKYFNVELKGFYEGYGNGYDVTPQSNIRQDLKGGSADVQYFFTRNIFAPYLVAGFGGMTGGVKGGSDTFLTSEAGAGFTYEFTDNLLFRSDMRYRYGHNFDAADNVNEMHDMTFNIGVVVPFGPKPKAMPQRPIEPSIRIPQPQIPDCSRLDSDQDGVNDCIDQCPGTLPGSRCNARGCPISLELKGVLFEYDSAVLTPNATVILDTVAQNLIQYPQTKDIEVHGHTSSKAVMLTICAYRKNARSRL